MGEELEVFAVLSLRCFSLLGHRDGSVVKAVALPV